jgi:hypothetical protein
MRTLRRLTNGKKRRKTGRLGRRTSGLAKARGFKTDGRRRSLRKIMTRGRPEAQTVVKHAPAQPYQSPIYFSIDILRVYGAFGLTRRLADSPTSGANAKRTRLMVTFFIRTSPVPLVVAVKKQHRNICANQYAGYLIVSRRIELLYTLLCVGQVLRRDDELPYLDIPFLQLSSQHFNISFLTSTPQNACTSLPRYYRARGWSNPWWRCSLHTLQCLPKRCVILPASIRGGASGTEEDLPGVGFCRTQARECRDGESQCEEAQVRSSGRECGYRDGAD